MINMILGIIEPNLETADLNDDGIINILDVITLVNLVLGSRTIDMSENIGTDAVIYKTANSVSISANGNIAGIQLTVAANNLQINENIPMIVESNLVGDQHIILMYGLNGETFSGDEIQLFTASEDYKISSIIMYVQLLPKLSGIILLVIKLSLPSIVIFQLRSLPPLL